MRRDIKIRDFFFLISFFSKKGRIGSISNLLLGTIILHCVVFYFGIEELATIDVKTSSCSSYATW